MTVYTCENITPLVRMKNLTYLQ